MCSEAIIYLPHNGNIAIDFVRNNEWSTNAIYIIVLLHSWRLYHQIAYVLFVHQLSRRWYEITCLATFTLGRNPALLLVRLIFGNVTIEHRRFLTL